MSTQTIEGVPLGTKIARLGVPKSGDWVVGRIVGMYQVGRDTNTYGSYVILAPDNIYNVCDLSTVPIPEGWERDGDSIEEWYRIAKNVEGYLTRTGKVWEYAPYGISTICPVICLRRLPPVTKRVLIGEWEIRTNASQQSSGFVGELAAQERVATRPMVYRIEERRL